MAKIQVIDHVEKYVKDVIPTQADREAYVAGRIAERSEANVLSNKLGKGKTSTPNGQ